MANSSENLILEEPSLWLDELLNEPDTPIKRGVQRHSSSEFLTHIDTFNTSNTCYANQAEYTYKNVTPIRSLSSSFERQEYDLHAKLTPSVTYPKCDKQRFAQLSRVRKVNYISEMERNVQALQAVGFDISTAVEFLNQKSIILRMENKLLKQRLESLAQELVIKYLEQEALEREVGGLRGLYQHQKQWQQQQAQRAGDLESQFANVSLKHKETSTQKN